TGPAGPEHPGAAPSSEGAALRHFVRDRASRYVSALEGRMSKPAAAPKITTAQPEDYFQLLKPRVMSLVIFTAVTGLVVAGGDIDVLSAAIAILCIAVGAGAAGALNMALEGETDALMRRTRGRP